MDALLPTFLAVLVASVGDKPQQLAALLSTRFRRDGAVLAGIALAALGNALVASIGGIVVRDFVPFRAIGLMTALALLLAGAGALLRPKRPTLEAYPRLGAFGASLFAFATLQFGDAVQLVTFALAARGGSAPLAAVGATAGVLVACAPAVLLGEAFERQVPVRALRIGCGMALVVAGLWAAVAALRLT